MKKLCNCGSKKSYFDCCAKYIENKSNAPSPELLMRSRYTAYSLAKIDYIIKTMTGKAALAYDALESEIWAKQVIWQKLEVVSSRLLNPNHGFVEFKAYYLDQQQSIILHELSEFKRINQQWFYIDGKMLN